MFRLSRGRADRSIRHVRRALAPALYPQTVLVVVLALAVGMVQPTVRTVHAQAADFDLDVPGGAHFYTQTNAGADATGFAVSNVDGVPFWNYFNEVGGVPAVGYPVSHRFLQDGFVVQAFQKFVFQWRPEVGTVYYTNILDQMHNAGLDPFLESVRQIPPPSDWSSDAGLPFDQVIARHQALLAANPAIEAAYFADPDPLNHFGLPMAPVQNMGGVLVLRAQRTAFQQWLTDRPWARAGQVTLVNGGDLGKEGGLYPPAAVVPQPASSVPLSVVNPTPTITPTPTGPCNGDETMTFNPASPSVGQQVFVSVTSARQFSNVSLTGPFNPQFVGVQPGGKGFVWSWTITPNEPGQFNYNFSPNNGATVCTTNFVLVGGSAPSSPTPTPQPATATPRPPTPTPRLVTPTPRPATPTPTPETALTCPSNFPVTTDPVQPATNRPFTVTMTGPSLRFGLQTLVGEGVQSVQSPTTNPGTLTAQVLVTAPGTYHYSYIINGRVCQEFNLSVVNLLL